MQKTKISKHAKYAMNLFEQTKNLCRDYGIKPARSRGQNFLIEEKIYDNMVAASELKPDDIVLEVGPGFGFLTAKLAVIAKTVVAVELDDKLAKALRARLKEQAIENVEIVNADILEFANRRPIAPKFKITANLPYNITSVFLRKFLSESENKPKLMILMLQKEVAERICAKTGQMSLLSASVQFYSKPEILQTVSKKNFWPEPEVDSAIVKITPNNASKLADEVREKNFFRLVKSGFSAKRKMLKNNLAAGFRVSQSEAENKIISAGFDPKVRAQELSIADWIKLLDFFIK